ncbi:hypothetical protein DFH28DRAFT_922516 [Melampsora americana]|nr:hypothetical protein DFH28DRAFT_922516 [Melampsora americana]
MRQTPPVTCNSNCGGHLGSPSNCGTPLDCGHGHGNAWLGTELAPPSLFQGDHSPTQFTVILQNQSPTFAENDQTSLWEANNPFTSTPVGPRQPPPHSHLPQTHHPQPLRTCPLSFNNFIGEPVDRVIHNQSEIHL